MKLKSKRMRDLIARSGLKVRDVAAAIGVSDSQLYNVLAGRRKLRLKESRRLIALFGADRMSMVIDWKGMGISDPFAVAR